MANDPFIAEADRHGWRLPMGSARSSSARDAVRQSANGEMCDRCDDLIQAFDDELMRAFWAKSGPFA